MSVKYFHVWAVAKSSKKGADVAVRAFNPNPKSAYGETSRKKLAPFVVDEVV